jgi:hypothetical protein
VRVELFGTIAHESRQLHMSLTAAYVVCVSLKLVDVAAVMFLHCTSTQGRLRYNIALGLCGLAQPTVCVRRADKHASVALRCRFVKRMQRMSR